MGEQAVLHVGEPGMALEERERNVVEPWERWLAFRTRALVSEEGGVTRASRCAVLGGWHSFSLP